MGGGEERGQGWWEDKGDVDARMCVVTLERGWPRGHEVFFNDGSAQDILRQVAVSMLTTRACALPQQLPLVETTGLDMESAAFRPSS